MHNSILCSYLLLFVGQPCPHGMERKYGQYDLGCQPTCENTNPLPGVGSCPEVNNTDWIDECFCKQGLVWNGEKCVDYKQCGCYFMGSYYQVHSKDQNKAMILTLHLQFVKLKNPATEDFSIRTQTRQGLLG